MNTSEAMDILESIAWECGGDLEEGYSGRGMYGDTCLAITSPDRNDTQIIEAAGREGITGARVDSMGLGVVVYWPRFKTVQP